VVDFGHWHLFSLSFWTAGAAGVALDREAETPRRLMPSSRVDAIRPISSGGTIWRLRVQGSSTACICAVFQAITMLASDAEGVDRALEKSEQQFH